MTFTIEDITPDKSELRLLVETYSDTDFYKSNVKKINEELGLLEIHGLDETILLMAKSGIVKNTNTGNSHVSYLIGVTTVRPDGPLKKKGGSLPD